MEKFGLQLITFENHVKHLPRLKVHTLDFFNSKWPTYTLIFLSTGRQCLGKKKAIILNIVCNNFEQVILNWIKSLESLDLQEGRIASFRIMQFLASNSSVSWVQTFVVQIALP